jgi:hypothetical protein
MYFYDEQTEQILASFPKLDYHCLHLVYLVYAFLVLDSGKMFFIDKDVSIKNSYTASCMADILAATIAAYHVLSVRKDRVHVLGYALEDAKAGFPIRLMLTPCR